MPFAAQSLPLACRFLAIEAAQAGRPATGGSAREAGVECGSGNAHLVIQNPALPLLRKRSPNPYLPSLLSWGRNLSVQNDATVSVDGFGEPCI
jgi:hypothetical protein